MLVAWRSSDCDFCDFLDVNIATSIMAQAAREERADDVAISISRLPPESVAYSPDVKTGSRSALVARS
jgi:hypothetical protein